MNRHAFVVMPFGEKPIEIGTDKNGAVLKIDFDKVYDDLLRPALVDAGCDVKRADEESIAGDIRTQVLFELVTADIVVADVSTPNANVFYELGIRHGVSPRGTLLLNGQWSPLRPFDIAPERSFSYKGALFGTTPPPDRDDQLKTERKRLATVLSNAVTDDHQTESSPLYAQLQGLKPVDWTQIHTSQARYFGGLEDNWMDRVRLAQAQGYPGHILTLSEEAPTRFHGEKLLFEAAKALSNLGWFVAAKEILEQILEYSPHHDEAQLQLALVFGMLGEIEKAELTLGRVAGRHMDNPDASALMGHVYRNMWRLRWQNGGDLAERQRKAIDSSQLAVASIRSYYHAQRCRPESYFNGFNVLILQRLLKYLSGVVQMQPADAEVIDEHELAAVVNFTCRCAHEKAVRIGDNVEQFWTLTTAAGLDLLAGDYSKAKQKIRDACNVPNATVLEVQTLRERLRLLEDLGYTCDGMIGEALKIVDEADKSRVHNPRSFDRVFVFAGCALEKERSRAIDSAEVVKSVTAQLVDEVQRFKITEKDLLITSMSHVSNVIFAQECRARGAHVRLLVDRSGGLPVLNCKGFCGAPEWENKVYALMHACETWNQDEHLGKPPDGSSTADRNRRWIANTVRVEAKGELHALLLTGKVGDCPNVRHDTEMLEKQIRECRGQIHHIVVDGLDTQAAVAT